MEYAVDAYRHEMWQIHDFQEEMFKSTRFFLMKQASAKTNQAGYLLDRLLFNDLDLSL